MPSDCSGASQGWTVNDGSLIASSRFNATAVRERHLFFPGPYRLPVRKGTSVPFSFHYAWDCFLHLSECRSKWAVYRILFFFPLHQTVGEKNPTTPTSTGDLSLKFLRASIVLLFFFKNSVHENIMKMDDFSGPVQKQNRAY